MPGVGVDVGRRACRHPAVAGPPAAGGPQQPADEDHAGEPARDEPGSSCVRCEARAAARQSPVVVRETQIRQFRVDDGATASRTHDGGTGVCVAVGIRARASAEVR